MYDRDAEYRYQIRETIEQDNFSRFRGLVNRAAAEIANIVHEVAVTVVSAAWTFITTTLLGKPNPSQPASNTPSEEVCFVATCVYGSSDNFQVRVLRTFRDDTLRRARLGRIFINVYYGGFGSAASRLLANRTLLMALVHRILDYIVELYLRSCERKASSN
jgi:hypothetical protein